MHGAGEEAAVQSREQLIEHSGGAAALIQCDVLLNVAICDGRDALRRLYELQSHRRGSTDTLDVFSNFSFWSFFHSITL